MATPHHPKPDPARDTGPFDHEAAPLRIGRVRLKVRDLEGLAGFYTDIIGLAQLESGPDHAILGIADRPLLELAGDPSLTPPGRRDAGLFHTAFLLPSRADLGRWLNFAMANRLSLQGASDHQVSEAVYLADPEGNGIEIYADRPPAHWHDSEGAIHMTTAPMDIEAVRASAGTTEWAGFPQGGFIGHVHLKVGDLLAAKGFYRDVLGFDLASTYPGAVFFGSGGYHHQLAGNIWNSRGAGPRAPDRAGLDRVEIIPRDSATRSAILGRARAAGVAIAENGASLSDPWGTIFTLGAGPDST